MTGGNKAEGCRRMHPETVMTVVNCVPKWLPEGISLAILIRLQDN